MARLQPEKIPKRAPGPLDLRRQQMLQVNVPHTASRSSIEPNPATAGQECLRSLSESVKLLLRYLGAALSTVVARGTFFELEAKLIVLGGTLGKSNHAPWGIPTRHARIMASV